MLADQNPLPVLVEGVRLLLPHDVWLAAGTALGFHRDQGFIPYDTDLDVEMAFDWGDPPTQDEMRRWLPGFKPIRVQEHEGHLMQWATMRNGVIFDIYFFYAGLEPDLLLNINEYGVIRMPRRFVEPLGQLTHQGAVFPAPQPIEEYLAWRYGDDWRTPTGKKVSWEHDASCLDPASTQPELP